MSLLVVGLGVKGQPAFDSVQFFLDEQPLSVTISTDLAALVNGKVKDAYLPATFSCSLADSSSLSEEIRLQVRGKSRRAICSIPPLRLLFRNPSSPKLQTLNTLKLVNCCRFRSADGQFLLKEYLAYKIYNILTEKSFRVRLLHITFEDSRGKKKPVKQYGFVIENVDALAKRNQCKEVDNVKILPEATDRDQMTLLALFEYMIGNTDWSVPNNHNIKLLQPKKNKTAKPYAVPYDFDNCGLVNPDYAVPDPIMGIESVVQRVYRGFPRTLPELKATIQVYNQQKEKIYSLVKNFQPLNTPVKKDLIRYLDEFYETINEEKEVKYVFIDKARTK
jgi:hypothetical protein